MLLHRRLLNGFAKPQGKNRCSYCRAVAVLSDPSSAENGTRKKKVAMWIGYVGTGYHGLQVHPGRLTIESELEAAIFKAGGILESNFGNHKKVFWARSSRTDKGVHSLSTIISLKLEVPINAWENDSCGIAIADQINNHLPSCIRVFEVVPVSKTFRPRIACTVRTYEYFLPLSCLGLERNLIDSNISGILQQFRSCLSLFEGEHPFHNYTARGIYCKPKEILNWNRRTPKEDDDGETSSDESCSSSDEAERQRLPQNLTKSLVFWLTEPDPKDMLKARHFRKIFSSTCGTVEQLGDAQVVRISISGASFMVHQIRKMVGTAVAVTRNLLPQDIIPLSLHRYSRIVLPIAPPQGLILSWSRFAPVINAESHTISLSNTGQQRRNTFWDQTVAPELASRMNSDDNPWKRWCTAMDSHCRLPEQEINAVRNAWKQQKRTQGSSNSSRRNQLAQGTKW